MKNTSNIYANIRLLPLLISLFLIFCLLSACSPSKSSSPTKVSPDWESEKSGLKRPINTMDEEYKEYLENAEQNEGKQIHEAIYELASYSVDWKLDASSLVVRGTIIGYDYVTDDINNVGEINVFTDYYLDVKEVFRGTPATSENGLIRVRTMGGENDEIIITNDEFLFEVGKEYIFFLVDSEGTDSDKADCGYYYPYALSAGVYIADDETVKNEKGEAVPKSFTVHNYGDSIEDGKIDYLAFVEKAAAYNESHPVD